MDGREYVIMFMVEEEQIGQVNCPAVPNVGDQIDMGSKVWAIVRRTWTPLSHGDTDVVIELETTRAERVRDLSQ